MTFICSAPGHGKQIVYAVVVAGCMMIEGLFMTWPNVVVDLIINANASSVTTESANTLPPSHIQEEFLLMDYEAGWLASLPTLSSIPFILLSGIFINLVGLKGSTILGLVLAIVSWLMIGLTPTITALFIGRAISGAAYAFIVTVSQPLVSELVSPKIRGVAASFPMFFSYLASLEMNVANIFLPWHLTTTFCAAPFFLLLLSILFVPESLEYTLYMVLHRVCSTPLYTEHVYQTDALGPLRRVFVAGSG
ncbi:solute carrier family 2, facilitated glucose transporter member 6-like [Oratosquilla oratoria]|uniref:solute carrier family 2, facilitated glucose transporter member 6-like n=1 Tax=Oratosquilla oratoria TaxID=337810 RepID=UPI003F760595